MGTVVNYIKDHWQEIIIFIIKIIINIFGKKKEKEVKVYNEDEKRRKIDFCNRNNYTYTCRRV